MSKPEFVRIEGSATAEVKPEQALYALTNLTGKQAQMVCEMIGAAAVKADSARDLAELYDAGQQGAALLNEKRG